MHAIRGRDFKRIGLALAMMLALPPAAHAVTDEEIFRDFRFNLANPGARSLGLGGAFIALADDATAALSNPSGLVLLSRPEIFGEVRQIDGKDSSNSFTVAGLTIDTGTSPESITTPSFIAYAYPWKRAAAAISYLDLTNVDNAASARGSLNLFGPIDIVNDGTIRTRVSVVNVSGAVKIVENLTFGATVAFSRLKMESEVLNTVQSGGMVQGNVVKTKTDDSDSDVAFNAGLHWQALPSLRFGAVYRGGQEFTTKEEIRLDRFGLGFSEFDNTFNTPDSYGAGVAWQPIPALTLSGDWVHIKYKDLLNGFQSGMNIGIIFLPLDYTIEDADEAHVGVEYVFSGGGVPWAIRGGAYTDHNTRIFGDETAFNTSVFGDPKAAGKVFPERDTEIHYTLGGGVVLAQRYQIDVAASISDLVNEYVLSGIFRF